MALLAAVKSLFFVVVAAGEASEHARRLQMASVPCPGSPASMHAWAAVQVTASATCDDVAKEMVARVAGQDPKTWRDPHDGGGGKQKYTLLDNTSGLLLSRLSDNGQYTDKVLFKFTGAGATCKVTGCSMSQGMSMMDQSTNYCNMRNLYCGSAERCCPMHRDFPWVEDKLEKLPAAGSDASVCLGGQGGSGGGMGGVEQKSCLSKVGDAASPSPTTNPAKEASPGPTTTPASSTTAAPAALPVSDAKLRSLTSLFIVGFVFVAL